MFLKKAAAILLASTMILCAPLALAGEAIETALVLGGNEITQGRGFLHNFLYLTRQDLEGLYQTTTGETTYKLRLGDSMIEQAVTYSTFEDHGVPTWGYRRVIGIDLQKAAGALGVDTGKSMAVTAYSSDGSKKTLSDAFNSKISRIAFDGQGRPAAQMPPILALFEKKLTTESRPAADEITVMPLAPIPSKDSDARVAPLFGFGQTEQDEITSCFWIKDVNRVRFGAEDIAFTLKTKEGKSKTLPISAIVLLGIYDESAGDESLLGLPLTVLLEGMGCALEEGQALTVVSADGRERTLEKKEAESAFVAWQAALKGVSVKNGTALRLYMGDTVFSDLAGAHIS